jgi:class 3 adenylate cyclase/Tfp pilus assembly protein PilF
MDTKKMKYRKRLLIMTLNLLIVLYTTPALASALDAYQELLPGATGTKKIEILNEIADRTLTRDEEKTLNYLAEAKKLATELNDPLGLLDVDIHLTFLKIIHNDYVTAIEDFDSLYKRAFALDYTRALGRIKLGKGILWLRLSEYQEALNAFEEAQSLFASIDYQRGVAEAQANIGVVYQSIGGYEKAFDAYALAAESFKVLKEGLEMADVYHNLGNLNEKMNKPDRAITYYTDALTLYEAAGDLRSAAAVYNSLGAYFLNNQMTEDSIGFFDKAFELYNTLKDPKGKADVLLSLGTVKGQNNDREGAKSDYLSALAAYEEAGFEEGIIIATNNLGSLAYQFGDYLLAIQYHEEALFRSQEVTYHDGLLSSLRNLSQDYQAAGQLDKANEFLRIYVEMNDYLIQESVRTATENKQVLYDTQKTEKALLEEQIAKAVLQEAQQRLLIIFSITVLIVIVISFLLIIISKERKKSEKLLLNILPKKIADTLKKHGKAEPERFDNVTVYFSDIVNFTTTSATLAPEALIQELSDIFTLFDNIMESHGCERIKTIGDAYLAVCGMPNPYEDHGQRMVTAAIEARDALQTRNLTSKVQWQIRIGVNSGSVVGGIVGVKKYIYDVFGDTINTASRMESNSDAMKINISEATYTLVHQHFNTTQRPEIEVKGKGLQKMYFVE